MNLRVGPHHNIWSMPLAGSPTPSTGLEGAPRGSEGGYTLVALLALMTVLALFALAVAPSIRQQAQREREVEAIYRGEQVAEAIRVYFSYQRSRARDPDAALPTSIDKLLEGLPSGTKKVQILRASAARDPLSESGEWRLIRPRGAELSDFTQAIMLFAENVRPPTNDPQLKQVEQLMAPVVMPTLGIATAGSSTFDDSNPTGPFIGVGSESKNNSVINYYGIGNHSDWIFTPLFR